MLPAFPLPECNMVIESLADEKVLMALDIKAAFNNILVPEQLQKYCGIIIQDDVYKYVMMAWGFNAAPRYF